MICIVGADGFFGSYMQKHILTNTTDERIICLNHSSIPYSDSERVINERFELWDKNSIKNAAGLISGYENIKILFLASVHNPDAVKKDPDAAQYINTVCYENFLKEISSLSIKKLVYASSDTVYGESTDGYIFTEKDTPSPINIYGRQKLMAEELTYKHSHTAARFSYMYAPSLLLRKKHFFDEVLNKLRRGEKIYMLTDWVRCALTYESAAEITYNLLLSDTKEKTVNICSDYRISKYDIGIEAAKTASCDSSLVVPATKKELDIFTEKRADEILMSNSLAKKINIIKESFSF